MGALRQAATVDQGWLTAAAVQARLVADASELARMLRTEPWRVWVSERGEAAILDRWRDHLSDCAVLGLWCTPGRVPLLVAELERIAEAAGFDRLVGPLLPQDAARPYLNAGMLVAERIVVMRLDRRATRRLAAEVTGDLPAGVSVRPAGSDDISGIVDLDARCFDHFWRYDRRLVERLSSAGIMLVAEGGSGPIGYTLATVHGSEASLGRLAVAPESRRMGIGHLLAREAIRWVAGQGAETVVLSSQEDNRAAQDLYRSLGFVVVPGHLVVCVSGRLSGPGEER